MSDQPPSNPRFAPQNKTTQELLSTNTVGLVALSDFRKRRAEVLEQQEREARLAALAARNSANANASTPDRSLTATPINASAEASEAERQQPKKKKKRTKALVSFGDDEEEEDSGGAGAGAGAGQELKKKGKGRANPAEKAGASSDDAGVEAERGSSIDDKDDKNTDGGGGGGGGSSSKEGSKAKVAVNASVGVVPRALTKAALRREAAEREALRKEFLMMQAAVKATEIAIPFVFYDGTNIPGGIVRVKKGDHVWLFLDKSRKVGARLGVGGGRRANARRDWARVSVDDLMLVRGTMIIPHHYDFYFFIMNKTVGPGNTILFDYSAEAPPQEEQSASSANGGVLQETRDISELEGVSDDPTFTKVVDRRWYQRNKHIYPASMWQTFDPEKDYSKEIRRDLGGNAFFFAK
ncbi:hypothetical protein VTJ83DRAFT_5143 [Remersonia thermophila]|uniref:FAM50A/XAP5 C-terminal domain-containing protein n=1 Tax=Remersonia thermophila TaxID=72144 RepID=A0ABR4DBZ9_9PEZI